MSRCSAAEADARVDTLARLLVEAKSTSWLLRFASDEWGITKRQAETYLARARQQVRDDYSVERAEFLASRLGVLESIAAKALASGQLSAACGAVRLQAELAQLIDK